MDMMSRVKVHSLATYHILLAKFEELIELHTLKLSMGFQQRFIHVSSSCLANKAPSLSQHIAKQRFNT